MTIQVHYIIFVSNCRQIVAIRPGPTDRIELRVFNNEFERGTRAVRQPVSAETISVRRSERPVERSKSEIGLDGELK